MIWPNIKFSCRIFYLYFYQEFYTKSPSSKKQAIAWLRFVATYQYSGKGSLNYRKWITFALIVIAEIDHLPPNQRRGTKIAATRVAAIHQKSDVSGWAFYANGIRIEP